jgi:hypothetical protein
MVFSHAFLKRYLRCLGLVNGILLLQYFGLLFPRFFVSPVLSQNHVAELPTGNRQLSMRIGAHRDFSYSNVK